MKNGMLTGFAALALLFAGSVPATAAPLILGSVYENVSSSQALLTARPAGAPDAQFFTQTIDYSSPPNDYRIGSFLNNPTFFNTSPTFSPADSLAVSPGRTGNTYFFFTGQTFLKAGDNTFSVRHDDGLQLAFFGLDGNPADSSLVVDEPGLTAAITTTRTVTATASGLYTFNLAYVEAAGPPAILLFQVNGQTVNPVPEPASLAMAGLGLVGWVGYSLRRRGRATA